MDSAPTPESAARDSRYIPTGRTRKSSAARRRNGPNRHQEPLDAALVARARRDEGRPHRHRSAPESGTRLTIRPKTSMLSNHGEPSIFRRDGEIRIFLPAIKPASNRRFPNFADLGIFRLSRTIFPSIWSTFWSFRLAQNAFHPCVVQPATRCRDRLRRRTPAGLLGGSQSHASAETN
jgi:hypothetical protein